MSWYSGEESSNFSYTSEGNGVTVGALQQPLWDTASPASTDAIGLAGTVLEVPTTAMDIQLLNDDHEKAILSDLCKSAGAESAPLTTFSYISEYICSNNIDIWPGEGPTMAGTGSCSAVWSDQRLPMSSCIHQQVYLRCKRVLETIIARNEQILALLRQKHRTNIKHYS
ncbi:uncharacterized protein LOC128721857 [Anopheles nili]|uniref:uncharacterized protein LOC128721857 n=1 Tax=Anopheles nili TaxID=185578 RepID=UPI00237BAAF2|nr:uncharacterized protein LOC128721857 [Anopheles nili]